MDFTSFLLLVGNCCLVPLLCVFLGYALAKGWIRSPVDTKKIRSNDDEGFAGEDPFSDD